MKRFRVFGYDLDSRASLLSNEIKDEWEDRVKVLHHENRKQIIQSVLNEYGPLNAERKLQDFTELGSLPFSIVAFHNKFLHQIRSAFTIGAYYPALTATCALGERILNHLVLELRNDYSATPEYKRVYDKDSFDNWIIPIETLGAWGVLLPNAIDAFNRLSKVRNQTIHFDPKTDEQDRPLALQAIELLNEIINEQFTAFGAQPWFIRDTPGEAFIKKEAEEIPFVKKVYLPNCLKVGPYHTMEYDQDHNSWIIHDIDYDDKEISDEEFVILRIGGKNSPSAEVI